MANLVGSYFSKGGHSATQTELNETMSVTMSIFRKKSFLFKPFVKTELSYVFTINMFSTAENCMEN